MQAYFDEWGQIVIEGNEDVFPGEFIEDGLV